MRITEAQLRKIIREEVAKAAHSEAPEIDELEEAEKGGPSPKTAKKMIRGKSWKEKVKSTSSWADNPEAAAAWLTHRATGKWPSED